MQAPAPRDLAPRRGSSHPAADTAFPVAGSRLLTLRSTQEAASQRRPRSIPKRWPTRSSPAGYASAAARGARADPTGAATAITGSPVTRRWRDDRGCVPERMDAGKPDAGCGVQGFEHIFDQLAEAGVDALDRLGYEPQPLVRKLYDLAYRHGRRFKSCLKRGQCARLLRKLARSNVQGTNLFLLGRGMWS